MDLVGKGRILLGCIYRPKESRGACDYVKPIRLAKKSVDAKKYSGLFLCGDIKFWYVIRVEDDIVDVPKENSTDFFEYAEQ